MKPKHLLYIPAALVVIAAVGFCWLYFRKPFAAPPSDIKIEMTEARIARGRYLFNLGDCDGCHSERDFTRFGGPVLEGRRGVGQVLPYNGLPGRIVARNITTDRETGLGAWTDGEKIRAIREGISRDGHMLFPMMPYPGYRRMSDTDVQALVAFLNTLAAVRNPLPTTEVKFPVSMFIKGVPQPAGKVREPDHSNQMEYGEYLAVMGGCIECHTPLKRGQPDESRMLGGGRSFATPQFSIVSANITPDDETGIGKWDYARFSQRFRNYREYVEHESPKVGPDRFTVMPWLNLSQIQEQDLQAIFVYLRSVPAVDQKIEKRKL